MLKTVGLFIAAVVVGVLVLAAATPGTFRVQRVASIQAPPEHVFSLINDFRRWDTWSPWEKKDPAMKRTFGASAAGKGATYAWEGNNGVGQGSMEIIESSVPRRIVLTLDFVKPFKAHNLVMFNLDEGDGVTHVTWKMEGRLPYAARVVHLFLDMDSTVGKDFETGLAELKSAAERQATASLDGRANEISVSDLR